MDYPSTTSLHPHVVFFLAPVRMSRGNREAVQLVMQRRSVCFAQIWTDLGDEHGKIQGMSEETHRLMKKEGFVQKPPKKQSGNVIKHGNGKFAYL